jgi:hypothetical protein
MLAGLPVSGQCRPVDSDRHSANPVPCRLVNPGMDDALTADLTAELPAAELVELLVARRALPGPRRDPRLLLVVGAVVASMAVGIAAHVIAPGPAADGPLREAASLEAGMAAVPSHPGLASTPADFVLAAATGGRPARGATVVVAGSARTPVRDAWLGVRVGGLVLGSRSSDLEAGQFSIPVPVFAPSLPAAIVIEARMSGPDGPVLGSATSTLASRSAVDVWSISARRAGETCRIVAVGPAPLAITRVDAQVVDRGTPIATDEVRIAPATGSAAGESLHLGRWQFDASWASPMAGGAAADVRTLRLELAWHDPADGTSSELSVPFPSCGAP